mgnify:CR=1 FL=1
MRLHFVTAKGLLSAQNGMNLYRGCRHGCIYCDSRSACYRMEHPFEDIEVKQNALILLEDALRRKRRPCMIATGSMSDPYTPPEEELRYTRRALELILQYGFGMTLLTKSSLVLRDLDLLQRINSQTKCVVQMTLTTWEESLCRILEPNVSTTTERFAALMKLKEAGIPTVVWLCPILPFLNDTAENINRLLDCCEQAGVRGIVQFGMGVTLRQGNREYFYRQLDRHFPGLKERYISTYGNAYVLESPNSRDLLELLHRRCRDAGILHDNPSVFRYLQEMEIKQPQQMSLYE